MIDRLTRELTSRRFHSDFWVLDSGFWVLGSGFSRACVHDVVRLAGRGCWEDGVRTGQDRGDAGGSMGRIGIEDEDVSSSSSSSSSFELGALNTSPQTIQPPKQRTTKATKVKSGDFVSLNHSTSNPETLKARTRRERLAQQTDHPIPSHPSVKLLQAACLLPT